VPTDAKWSSEHQFLDKMKLFTTPQLASALAIGVSVQTAFAAPALLQRQREVANSIPKFSFDPNTSKYCVWWIDSDGTWTCQALKNIYGVAIDDFVIWVRPVLPPWHEKQANSH
jgi:hypothetical protein